MCMGINFVGKMTIGLRWLLGFGFIFSSRKFYCKMVLGILNIPLISYVIRYFFMKVTWSPIFKRKLKALYQFIHCFKCRKNGCKAKILNKNLKVQFNAGRIHCYNFILWFLLYKIKDSILDMLHTYSKFLVISSQSSNY